MIYIWSSLVQVPFLKHFVMRTGVYNNPHFIAINNMSIYADDENFKDLRVDLNSHGKSPGILWQKCMAGLRVVFLIRSCHNHTLKYLIWGWEQN